MTQVYKQPTKFFKTNRAQAQCFLLDAKGKTLGRLASEIAKVLSGKHRPQYTPNADVGDRVIVINAKEILVTGSKEAQKVYRHHTGFIGGLKEIPYRRMLERHPERIVQHAVKGMMPKTRLGRACFKKLHVFAGGDHNMEAQKPITVGI